MRESSCLLGKTQQWCAITDALHTWHSFFQSAEHSLDSQTLLYSGWDITSGLINGKEGNLPPDFLFLWLSALETWPWMIAAKQQCTEFRNKTVRCFGVKFPLGVLLLGHTHLLCLALFLCVLRLVLSSIMDNWGPYMVVSLCSSLAWWSVGSLRLQHAWVSLGNHLNVHILIPHIWVRTEICIYPKLPDDTHVTSV